MSSLSIRYSIGHSRFLYKLAHFGRSTFFMKFKDCRKEKLFEHEPTAKDCRQLAVEDCWLQSILIDILSKKGPKPIKEMLKDDGASGNVKVRLYRPSSKLDDETRDYYGDYVPRIYTVPKQIPVLRLINMDIYNSGAKWVHYVQAAVAKSGIRNKYYKENYTKEGNNNKTRDYSSIDGGNEIFGWPMILGNYTKLTSIRSSKSKLNKNTEKFENYRLDDLVDNFVDNFSNIIGMSILDVNGTTWYLKGRGAINKNIDLISPTFKECINDALDIIAPEHKIKQGELKSENNVKLLKEYYIYYLLKKMVANKNLIGMSFKDLGKSDGAGISGGERMSKGLAEAHQYSVCGCEEDGGEKYIRLINPWYNRMGRDEERGKGKSFKGGEKDESFRLKISTFVKYMDEINIGII